MTQLPARLPDDPCSLFAQLAHTPGERLHRRTLIGVGTESTRLGGECGAKLIFQSFADENEIAPRLPIGLDQSTYTGSLLLKLRKLLAKLRDALKHLLNERFRFGHGTRNSV